MSVPTMETSTEPRQPSLFEKKMNTRLVWARLLGHVHELLPAAGVNPQEQWHASWV